MSHSRANLDDPLVQEIWGQVQRLISDPIDVEERQELLRHWDRLDREKRKLLLLLARDMGGAS